MAVVLAGRLSKLGSMNAKTENLSLEIVVPCYNEESTLAAHVRRLHAYLSASVPQTWRITIADNASTDSTAAVADDLERSLPGVLAVHLPVKGRGLALKAVWSASPADVLAYVDEDLSTDLAAVAPLVAPLLSGHSDVAIGTRLSGSSRVSRGGRREFISRGYNLLLRIVFSVGFKAIRRDAAIRLLPLIEDGAWFFDTELLVLAERAGLRIHEVPVDWIDDPDSSVDIARTARDDLAGMARLGWSLARRRIPLGQVYAELGRRPFARQRPGTVQQVVRFALIGGLSTVAFALLFLLLRTLMVAQAASFLALLITAVANTALNRRLTFGIRGRPGAARHQLQGLAVFALAWCLTSGSLVLTHAVVPHPPASAEVAALTAANLLATVLRFVLFRVWVFRDRQAEDTVQVQAGSGDGTGTGIAAEAALGPGTGAALGGETAAPPPAPARVAASGPDTHAAARAHDPAGRSVRS